MLSWCKGTLFFFLLSFGGSNLSQINLFEKSWLFCLLPFAWWRVGKYSRTSCRAGKNKTNPKKYERSRLSKSFEQPFWMKHMFINLSEVFIRSDLQMGEWAVTGATVQHSCEERIHTHTQNNGNNQSNYARRIRLKKLKSASLRYRRRDASQRSESGGTWSWIDFCTTLMFKTGRLCP